MPITTSAYQLARHFVGVREIQGALDNPAIVAMLKFYDKSIEDDETPWCSAFVGIIAYFLDLPQTKSLRARSWLTMGMKIELTAARPENDVVIFSRGNNPPGPSVVKAPGHVAFFSRLDGDRVWVLGGNQGNAVSVEPYPVSRVLGVRRLYPVGI